jgi:PIN domain nuclease of toxin-antitoxin system
VAFVGVARSDVEWGSSQHARFENISKSQLLKKVSKMMLSASSFWKLGKNWQSHRLLPQNCYFFPSKTVAFFNARSVGMARQRNRSL